MWSKVRMDITGMPERGVRIEEIPSSGGLCNVYLYKDLSTEKTDADDRLSANVVTLTMQYYEGLQLEIESNFEHYFEIGLQKELVIAKDAKKQAIKAQILTVPYDTLMARYNAVDDAKTIEELEAI